MLVFWPNLYLPILSLCTFFEQLRPRKAKNNCLKSFEPKTECRWRLWEVTEVTVAAFAVKNRKSGFIHLKKQLQYCNIDQ